MKLVIGVTALAGGAALMLAGCGTTHATPGGAGGATSASLAPATSAPPATTAAGASPRERAMTDATTILGSFVSPAHATRLSGAPDLPGGALRAPAFVPASPDIVDDVSWWRVPGSPQAVLTWEKAHLPHQFTAAGVTSAGVPATVWSDQFALPAVTGVLPSRVLDVQAASAGHGQTVVRVDAVVLWQPARPASERIPTTAGAVTLTAVTGPPTETMIPGPVTITNAATVRRLATLVNNLGPFPPGRFSCPMDTGRALRLTFTAKPGGPALAVVTASLSGCGAVGVTLDGKQQPPLAGGTLLARQAMSAAGLHWTGYSGGGGIHPGSPVLRSQPVLPGGGARPAGGSPARG